jgi:hypothetical protein
MIFGSDAITFALQIIKYPAPHSAIISRYAPGIQNIPRRR